MLTVDGLDSEFLRNVLKTIARGNKVSCYVLARNQIPHEISRENDAALIFNTHFDTQPGEHWVAVFIDSELSKAFLFDSLPLRTFPQEITSWLRSFCDQVVHENEDLFVLQDPSFPLCGLYCLAFLDCCLNRTELNLFKDEPLLNDVYIVDKLWPVIQESVFKKNI